MGPPGLVGERGPPGIKGDKGEGVGDLPATIQSVRDEMGDRLTAISEKVDGLDRGVGDLEKILADVVSVLESFQSQFSNFTRNHFPQFKIIRSESTQNYEYSKRFCNSMGGRLVSSAMSKSLHMEKSNKEVMSKLAADFSWIDLSDEAHEGNWRTSDGVALYDLIFNWHSGQPGGGRRQNCAVVRNQPALELHDATCSSNYYALCEIPLY